MFWESTKRLFVVSTIIISTVLPAKSADFSGYMADVNDRIQKTWNPPEDVIQGQADVVFKVSKSGEVLSAHITRSSGNENFDKSVMLALNKCIFQELPQDAKDDNITIKYSFNLHAADSERMKEYAEMAEKCYFYDKKLALKYLNMAIDEINGDSASYFLYARRCKIHKELGNIEAANADLLEFNRLKALNDEKRVRACKKEVLKENTPFSYFTLANAYDVAGDYKNAMIAINQAIQMTPLNHAYIRYKAEMIMRHDKDLN